MYFVFFVFVFWWLCWFCICIVVLEFLPFTYPPPPWPSPPAFLPNFSCNQTLPDFFGNDRSRRMMLRILLRVTPRYYCDITLIQMQYSSMTPTWYGSRCSKLSGVKCDRSGGYEQNILPEAGSRGVARKYWWGLSYFFRAGVELGLRKLPSRRQKSRWRQSWPLPGQMST